MKTMIYSHLDYGFRIYNPAIGRFLSVDPLTESYPWYTPYQFAGNKPIWAIDLDGLEEYVANVLHFERDGTTKLELLYDTKVDALADDLFYLNHVYYDKDGDYAGGSQGTGSGSEYPGYFPFEGPYSERSDGRGLLTLEKTVKLFYGKFSGDIKFLGSELGLEFGAENDIIGYEGFLNNTSEEDLNHALDNIVYLGKDKSVDERVSMGISAIVGSKITNVHSRSGSYEGNESIELSTGFFKYNVNSSGDESYKVEVGGELSIYFGGKWEIGLSINPKPATNFTLFDQQQLQRLRTSIGQDNTRVTIPIIIQDSPQP